MAGRSVAGVPRDGEARPNGRPRRQWSRSIGVAASSPQPLIEPEAHAAAAQCALAVRMRTLAARATATGSRPVRARRRERTVAAVRARYASTVGTAGIPCRARNCRHSAPRLMAPSRPMRAPPPGPTRTLSTPFHTITGPHASDALALHDARCAWPAQPTRSPSTRPPDAPPPLRHA